MFRNAPDEFPEPIPERLAESWAIATEDGFNADRLAAAAEAQMAGKFTDAELRELYAYFSSPLGRKVAALEIAEAGSDYTEAREAEGDRIWSDMAAKDPERLALYNRMIDGLDAVDFAEVLALNMAYGMMTGLFAEAGVPVTSEATLALIKSATADLRQSAEKGVRASVALTYRDLPNDELEKHVAFLETPAGARYYEVSLQAFDHVLSKEARDFGNSLFEALGMRKA
jgi:hypothetical protein